MNFLIAGYGYSDGDLFTDPSSPPQEAKLWISTGHVAYAWALSLWGKLRGGRTPIDGVPDKEVTGNSRVGATLAFPVNRNSSLRLYASTGTACDLAGIARQYRW